MKSTIFLALSLCSVVLLSACSGTQDSQQPEAAYHKITAEEGKKMMDQEDIILVDVRTGDEYAQAHIPNALLIPNETIGEEMPDQLPDTDSVLVLYCRSGNRSKQAADKLIRLGYKNIYDMGGLIDWPYETESGEPQS